LLVARNGAAGGLAADAGRVGGTIRYRNDEVGYFRIKVPLDRVDELVTTANVEAATVDLDDGFPGRLTADREGFEARPLEGSALPPRDRPPEGTQAEETWPPKWSDYPLRRPYTPIKEIDADQMRQAHPTFDGRGVTIALLDGNMDMLLPEFQTGYALDGTPQPKFV